MQQHGVGSQKRFLVKEIKYIKTLGCPSFHSLIMYLFIIWEQLLPFWIRFNIFRLLLTIYFVVNTNYSNNNLLASCHFGLSSIVSEGNIRITCYKDTIIHNFESFYFWEQNGFLLQMYFNIHVFVILTWLPSFAL